MAIYASKTATSTKLSLAACACMYLGLCVSICVTPAAAQEADLSYLGKSCVVRFAHVDCGESLACLNATCSFCETSNDCLVLGLVCANTTDGRVCQHKALFPMDWRDVVGTVVSFLAVALAVGGGIGGGGVLVPVYILIVQFSTHEAIPLSKATIFGAACSQFFFNSRKRHPLADRPLIDYDTSMILEPMTLGGTIAGVFFNRMFPEWLITLLLVVFLSITTMRTIQKGFSLHQKELIREAETKQKEILDGFGVDSTANRRWWHSTFQDDYDDNTALIAPQRVSTQKSMFSPLDRLMYTEKHTPMINILILFGVWVLVLFSQLLKGGEGASISGVKCGTVWYWIIVGTMLPILFGITWLIGRRLLRNHKFKQRIGYIFREGDIHWNRRGVLLYPSLCWFAGLAAGMLGIGGGMVKGPLMLEMGMLPMVSTASSAFMILFTSSCTTAQFMILGMLKWDYALWFYFLGVVSSFVGMVLVGAFLRKYNKVSVLVFLLGITIGLSTILMGLSGTIGVVERMQAGRPEPFRSLCHKGH